MDAISKQIWKLFFAIIYVIVMVSVSIGLFEYAWDMVTTHLK